MAIKVYDKPTPSGWPRISAAVFYEDPAAAIEWLCDALGFEVRLKIEGEGGRIEHSELELGEGLIMVGTAGGNARPGRDFAASPRSVGGKNTQSLAVFVDDVDALCRHAQERGAKVVDEPQTHDYGDDYWVDRSCRIEDLEGHHWWLMQRIRG